MLLCSYPAVSVDIQLSVDVVAFTVEQARWVGFLMSGARMWVLTVPIQL